MIYEGGGGYSDYFCIEKPGTQKCNKFLNLKIYKDKAYIGS